MKKIRRLSLVLFIFSVLAFSYPATQVFAEGGAHVSGAHLSGGQCDSSPACNPASGTCCGQCDPSPACNPNDPNGIPCCGLEGNNMTNGSQPPGGFEPPRRPLKKNDLDPRLVEKMEKMKHELQACQSLKEEIRGQQQTASRQAPGRCQPDGATQRALLEVSELHENICIFVTDFVTGNYFSRTGQGDPLRQFIVRIAVQCDQFITHPRYDQICTYPHVCDPNYCESNIFRNTHPEMDPEQCRQHYHALNPF